MTFTDFIFRDKKNRIYFWLALGLSIVNLFVFKGYWLPQANFGYATYGLIEAAVSHSSVSLWPIGYSQFIWAFHHFSHSDIALVSVQYLFLTGVLLYFFFTLHYFYTLAKNSFLLLFVFLFFDPLFLYLANCVTSDALFLGFSLWWFTQLIWIQRRPRPYQVVTQALLLFVAFTLSYHAAWYPVVAIAAFGFSRQPLGWKLTGVLLPVLLLGLFIMRTRDANYRETGTPQFSVFSGWREANNALFMYPHISVDSSSMPAQFSALNDRVKGFFSKAGPNLRKMGPLNGLFYLVTPETPLQTYISPDGHQRRPITGYKEWGAVSALYDDYGRFLARRHPGAYVRYYLLPNTKEYFWPRIELLTTYNMEHDSISPEIKNWFDYPDAKPKYNDRGIAETVLSAFPIFFPVINIAFMVGIIWFLLSGERRKAYPSLWPGLSLAAFFLLVNAVCNIWFAPIILESLLLSVIVCFGFVLLLYDFIEKKYKTG